MTPIFSILHATYGRPKKAIDAMRMVIERAINPASLEYIFAVNADDNQLPSTRAMAEVMANFQMPKIVMGKYAGSAPAWDAAAKHCRGDILIQMQDDVEPPYAWDMAVLDAFSKNGDDWRKRPMFVQVSDGYRRDGFCFMAIMNRAYYEMQGEFLHAGYISMFSDDDVFYRAKKNARDGKSLLVDAREIVFKHEHYVHNKTVEMDATYDRENSQEAYRIGGKLFFERNPHAHLDGLRNWGG